MKCGTIVKSNDIAETRQENSESFPKYWIPNKWNEECYDFLYQSDADNLYAGQITRAETHSCHARVLREFADRLKVKKVHLFYICDEKNYESFRLPSEHDSTFYVNMKKRKDTEEARLQELYWKEHFHISKWLYVRR